MPETTDIQPQPVVDPPLPNRSNVLGLVSMIFGIVAFIFAVIPPIAVVSWFFALPGFILALIGLIRKRQPKLTSRVGVILSSVAFVLSIITFSIYAAGLPSIDQSSSSTTTAPAHHASARPKATQATTPKPKATKPKPKPTSSSFDTSAYASLSDHDFALLVKDPAAAKGKKYVIYGVVTQFDAATGTCSFLADTSDADQADAFDFSQNTWVDSMTTAGKCPIVTNVVEGDHLEMWVIVKGAYSYDTQAGGNTTVPRFKLTHVTELPALQ
jgi:hypothetical protein